jgi:serine protease Do
MESGFRCALVTTLILCLTVAGRLHAQEPLPAATAASLESTVVKAIARAEPSVVAIARVRKDEPGETFRLELRPDSFDRKTLPAVPPQPTDPDFIPNEYGAGVVIAPEGLILTAYHLLAPQSDYYVTTADHKTFRAKPKGADPRSDLAVLAIEARDLTPITFGDAAQLKKGQFVISLGNPHVVARDGQASAALGIVANLARKAPPTPSQSDPSGRTTLHHYGTLIQTDAKLNLGASGGPLVNLQGEMVGLSVAFVAVAGYDSGGGYAIPVDQTFRRAVQTLVQGREVEYGFLGVRPVNLRPDEVLDGLQAARVGQVLPGTPAARFGLKPDDLITAVNDTPIHDADSLILNVGKLPPEAVASLSVLRGGHRQTVRVTLAKYAVRGEKIITTTDPAWRGLRVDYPTAATGDKGGVDDSLSATPDSVMVIEVVEGSPAWQSGLRRGMLISHVDGTPVSTPKQFAAAVAGRQGPVQLRLVGEDKVSLLTVGL